MLKIGDKDAKGLYYGSSTVAKAFLGSTQVWPSLPYDAEVQWLESTGTQWIDTGTTPQYSSTVIFDAIVGVSTKTNNRRFIYGDQNGSISHYSDIQGMKYGSHQAYCNFIMSPNVMYNTKSIFEPTKLTHNINGVTLSSTLYASRNWGRILLFRLNASYVGANQRLGNISITVNSIVTRDFIPVRFTNENGQSEGAMYDKVSKQLFRNKGTGSFVIGPDN